ncbi:MAG TPA: hypothetical protein VG963_16255 [Polyangiaceae bacterium]|nr:hypothetical protein [Polyangiaceae bacterium]
MTKLTIAAFSLVTALSGTALAHDGNYRADQVRSVRHEQPVRVYAAPVTAASPFNVNDLRMSDANHDGNVTLREAMRAGRADFARSDVNRDGVLSPRELSRAGFVQADQNRDGVVSLAEYQSDVRRSFQMRDANRDGMVDYRELSLRGPWLNPARGPQRW